MKSLHPWPAILLAALALVGCVASDGPTATPTSHTSPLESPASDGPTATPTYHTSPLESPLSTATPALEQAVPTPGSDTGVVVGAIEVEELGDPMRGVQLFLGEPVGSNQEEPLFGLDPSRAPGTQVDEQGRFVLPDVPPGDYVIILWNPMNSILARDPKTREPLLLSVEAGEVVDVGTLSEPQP